MVLYSLSKEKQTLTTFTSFSQYLRAARSDHTCRAQHNPGGAARFGAALCRAQGGQCVCWSGGRGSRMELAAVEFKPFGKTQDGH